MLEISSIIKNNSALRLNNVSEPISRLLYVAICLAMVSSGTTSLFGIYGTGFSELLNYSTYHTSFLITILEYAYHLSAPIFGHLSAKIGPKRCLRIGSFFLALGYVGLAKLFDNREFSLNYPGLSSFISTCLIVLVGSGSKAIYMSCLSTTTFLYSKSIFIGIALSIPVSMSGISSYIFANLKTIFFSTSTTPADFLFFLGVSNGISAFLLSSLFFDGALRETAGNLQTLSAKKELDVSTVIELSNMNNESSIANDDISKTDTVGSTYSFPTNTLSFRFLLGSLGLFSKRLSLTKPLFTKFSIPQPYSFLKTPLFGIFLLGIASSSGPAIMFINSSGLITKALANSPKENLSTEEIELLKNQVVAKFALCSFLGRFLSGFLSDFFRIYFKAPTAFFLFLGSLTMLRSQAFLGSLVSTDGILALSSGVGVAYGSLFSLAPKLATELWGHKNFGIAWGILSVGPAVGSHICNAILATFWDLDISKAGLVDPHSPGLQCNYKCIRNVSRYTSMFGIISILCFLFMVVRHFMYKK